MMYTPNYDFTPHPAKIGRVFARSHHRSKFALTLSGRRIIVKAKAIKPAPMMSAARLSLGPTLFIAREAYDSTEKKAVSEPMLRQQPRAAAISCGACRAVLY